MKSDCRFISILVYSLPDLAGWQIIGIRVDKRRELIADIPQIAGEEAVEFLAHYFAKELALITEVEYE